MSSGKWRPSCLGLNVLIQLQLNVGHEYVITSTSNYIIWLLTRALKLTWWFDWTFMEIGAWARENIVCK